MRGHDLFRYAGLAALLACYVTIILGGNVIASDSGLGCPSWPSCNGTFNLLPSASGASAVEWAHRVSAFFLAVVIVILSAFALAYERRRPVLLKLSLFSLALVVALALLGGAVVESSLDISLVLLHFALATILFGVLLVLVLLSNLRSLSRRWVNWAVKASEEQEFDPYAPAGSGEPTDRTGPTGPSPGPEG
ncbi:MAG: COX15/CtaA family protein [Thermoplasmata archaeon]|jgi:cytochrome c oxidase assembly protein subunit 15